MRDLDASKYVRTDVKEYLEKDAHVTCISCVDCIKQKQKVLQYKYQPELKSSYAANFINSDDKHREKMWNLDYEKRQLKIAFKPPATYQSTYGVQFSPVKTDSKMNFGPRNRGGGNDVASPFIGSSSYNNHGNYGALPKANIKEQKKFTAGFGDFDGISTYNARFNGSGAEAHHKAQAEEKQKVKEYGIRQQRGNLTNAPDQQAPFKG